MWIIDEEEEEVIEEKKLQFAVHEGKSKMKIQSESYRIQLGVFRFELGPGFERKTMK
jgi:hypothetical protein